MPRARFADASYVAAVARGFDRLAPGYDAAYPRNRSLARLQEAGRAAWRAAARPGERWLELGSGTGRDALALARAGVRVVATDPSAGMLARIRARARAARGRIVALRLATPDLDRLLPRHAGAFAGVAALCGALNYDPAPARTPARLWRLLRPGGRAVVAVRNRVCPWEIGWNLFVHPAPRLAFRRFARAGAVTDLGAEPVVMRVFTPGEFRRLWAPWFTVTSWSGLCVALPPYMIAGLGRRLPRLERVLAAADPVAGRLPGLRALGDHFLMTLRRRDRPA